MDNRLRDTYVPRKSKGFTDCPRCHTRILERGLKKTKSCPTCSLLFSPLVCRSCDDGLSFGRIDDDPGFPKYWYCENLFEHEEYREMRKLNSQSRAKLRTFGSSPKDAFVLLHESEAQGKVQPIEASRTLTASQHTRILQNRKAALALLQRKRDQREMNKMIRSNCSLTLIQKQRIEENRNAALLLLLKCKRRRLIEGRRKTALLLLERTKQKRAAVMTSVAVKEDSVPPQDLYFDDESFVEACVNTEVLFLERSRSSLDVVISDAVLVQAQNDQDSRNQADLSFTSLGPISQKVSHVSTDLQFASPPFELPNVSPKKRKVKAFVKPKAIADFIVVPSTEQTECRRSTRKRKPKVY